MILAGRWPPVQLASDAQCYRERINRERAHRRPERPQTTATAVPLPYNVPNPMYSWKPLTRTQKVLVPLSPRGAEPRSFGRVDGAQVPPRSELLVPTMVPTTSVPFTQFSTKPFRVEYSTLPQRTPEHLDACSEMTQMSWFEPPLVMSRNYCEPRNVFNSYVEHSTASVARPAAIWPARAPEEGLLLTLWAGCELRPHPHPLSATMPRFLPRCGVLDGWTMDMWLGSGGHERRIVH
jgi:hypothetical protein